MTYYMSKAKVYVEKPKVPGSMKQASVLSPILSSSYNSPGSSVVNLNNKWAGDLSDGSVHFAHPQTAYSSGPFKFSKTFY